MNKYSFYSVVRQLEFTEIKDMNSARNGSVRGSVLKVSRVTVHAHDVRVCPPQVIKTMRGKRVNEKDVNSRHCWIKPYILRMKGARRHSAVGTEAVECLFGRESLP